MQITKEFIELGTTKDTLNQTQCDILGIEYPPTPKDLEEIIGKELSTKEVNIFLFLKGDFSKKAQKQILKNYQLVANFHKKKKDKPQLIDNSNQNIEIYCDGACSGNPGEAGSGLAIYQSKERPTLLYGGYEKLGTNNTAELKALYKALEIASNSLSATIKSDSRYSIDCITKWAYGWKSNGWSKKGGEIKNLEIIKLSHELYESIKDRVTIEYVKGHSGVEGNELADEMARLAIAKQQIDFQEFKK